MTGPAAVPAPTVPGSISLGLHRHVGCDPSDAVARAAAEAVAAEAAGFDGVTFSEHHLDFPGYFPNPLAAAAMVLERTEAVWSGPMPMLLPLRPPALVAEDLAWLASTHPGRLVAGFAAGNQPTEHALVGSGGDLVRDFAAGLALLGTVLGTADGEHGLLADPAVRAQRGAVPLLSAARSGTAVRRAAGAGAGLLYSSRSSDEELARLTDGYLAAGGSGARVVVAEIWLGDRPAASEEPAPVASSLDWDDRYRTSGGADAIAETLIARLVRAGANALNLRVHVSGVAPSGIDEQIRAVGADLLPVLRRELASIGTSR